MRMGRRPGVMVQGLAILLPLAAGAVFLLVSVALKDEPSRDAGERTAKTVTFVEAETARLRPVVEAFGTVRPARTFKAVAEVAGRVAERHPALREGGVVAAGEILIRVDPRDYRLAVAEAEAEVDRLDAALAALDTRATTLSETREVEARALALAENDHGRQERLAARGSVPPAAAERVERDMLAQAVRLRQLDTDIALLPHERAQLEARFAAAEARLGRARLDLARTRIAAPFNLLVIEAPVEPGEAVAPGTVLARGADARRIEVVARLPVERLAHVLGRDDGDPFRLADMDAALAQLSASLQLAHGAGASAIPAEVERLAPSLDPRARTAGVIVSAQRPSGFRSARPPLPRDGFVLVELEGPPRPPRIAVPRSSLEGDRLYLAGPDDRLAVREVIVAGRQGDMVEITGGLNPGERVLTTPPVPAVEGMRLDPMPASAEMPLTAGAADRNRP